MSDLSSMERVQLTVRYDPSLVSPEFLAEHILELEGVEAVADEANMERDLRLNKLREAIVADVSEDLDLIGQMVEWHEELVAAFNAVPGVTPITNADLDVDAEDE